MYDLNEYFPNNFFTSLKEASMDTVNKTPMVNHSFNVLKLDDYNKNHYQQELSCSQCLRGADAFFIKNEKLYFIEFKNRYPTVANKKEILEKMYASSIVIMDKLNLNLSLLKQNACFITVYTFKDDCQEKELYNPTTSYGSLKKIQTHIKSKINCKIKDIDKNAFGLKKLEKYIYNEVNAIPINFFDKYLQEEGII